MKFMGGMVFGGLLVTGAVMMYNNNFNKMYTKKAMKKGKQFVKKMGLI